MYDEEEIKFIQESYNRGISMLLGMAIAYIVLCILIAFAFKGRRKISMTSMFFIGLFFTPAVQLFVGLVYPKAERDEFCSNCGSIKQIERTFCPVCKRNRLGKTAAEVQVGE